ncbi:MAG: exodeoxyribonuclease VII small subunit [Gammaproteobacteria bacterium]|nr:exodeoxyribonuclease VII small subunit [Gammaproteobacteria bacterium]
MVRTPVARTPRQPNFEQTLTDLEALVARLESGELPLDQALATFEQGVKLTRACQAALQAAQQKVLILTQQDGAARLSDFNADVDARDDSDDADGS